jgi:hypothetical protein
MVNWFNWFHNDAARRPAVRPRRRLGAGFEAIEPRLLMARDAVPHDLLPGNDGSVTDAAAYISDEAAGRVDRTSLDAVSSRTSGKDSLPADTATTGKENFAADSAKSTAPGGFVDIGGDDRVDKGMDDGSSWGKDSGAVGFDGSFDGDANDGDTSLFDEPTDLPPSEESLAPQGFGPRSGDSAIDDGGFDDDSIGIHVGDDSIIGTAPAGDVPEGADETGPEASAQPAPGPVVFEKFTPSSPQPERLGAPLPDSDDDQGGGIDITPRGPAEHEDESVASTPQQLARTAAPGTEAERSPVAVSSEADVALRASRGESQAFELAMSNWRREHVVVQRVAPPKPDQLPRTKGAIANCPLIDEARPVAGSAAATKAEPRGAADIAEAEPAPVTIKLGLLPELQQALLAGMNSPVEQGEVDAAVSPCGGHHACGSRTPSGIEEISAAAQHSSQQQLPAADHDTAARVVGVSLIVIAGQASAMYLQPERPVVQRNATRDWQLNP